MKIPFDIKYRPQIESGEYKVENRDGRPVRIICWDKKSEKKYGYHIVGLIEYGPKHEESTYYTIDGKGRLNANEPDLFIVTPEPELSEFEKGLANLVSVSIRAVLPNNGDYEDALTSESIIVAKMYSAELLELARKELVEEQFTSDATKTNLYKLGKAEALKEIKQDPESSYAFKRGVEYGKEEALKDLPRWEKLPDGIMNQVRLMDKAIIVNHHYIFYSDLEKLPGFNE